MQVGSRIDSSDIEKAPRWSKFKDRKIKMHEHDDCMDMPSEVGDAFRSGNGTIDSVGMKLSGKVPCLHCNQKFDTAQALSMHCKFIHDQVSDMNVGYALSYEFNETKRIDA